MEIDELLLVAATYQYMYYSLLNNNIHLECFSTQGKHYKDSEYLHSHINEIYTKQLYIVVGYLEMGFQVNSYKPI